MSRIAPRGSIYCGSADGDDLFGEFPNCRILGYNCTIHCRRIDDGDPRAFDAFGVPVKRGDLMIHISGKDSFGDVAYPSRVVEVCLIRNVFDRVPNNVYGLRCGEESIAILTGNYQRHHAFVDGPDGYMSLAGARLLAPASGRFTPRDVLTVLDAKRREAKGWSWTIADGPQHTGALRRLLLAGIENDWCDADGAKFARAARNGFSVVAGGERGR